MMHTSIFCSWEPRGSTRPYLRRIVRPHTTGGSCHGDRYAGLGPKPGTNDVIANYNLYYGAASGTYTNVVAAGTNLTVSVSNLLEGHNLLFRRHSG